MSASQQNGRLRRRKKEAPHQELTQWALGSILHSRQSAPPRNRNRSHMSRRLDHKKLEVYQAALTFITWLESILRDVPKSLARAIDCTTNTSAARTTASRLRLRGTLQKSTMRPAPPLACVSGLNTLGEDCSHAGCLTVFVSKRLHSACHPSPGVLVACHRLGDVAAWP